MEHHVQLIQTSASIREKPTPGKPGLWWIITSAVPAWTRFEPPLMHTSIADDRIHTSTGLQQTSACSGPVSAESCVNGHKVSEEVVMSAMSLSISETHICKCLKL